MCIRDSTNAVIEYESRDHTAWASLTKHSAILHQPAMRPSTQSTYHGAEPAREAAKATGASR
eukprot:572649-Pyramimonas_sp.AAC.1